MKQNTAVLRALHSIQMMMVIDDVQYDIIQSHLHCIYAAGFIEGRITNSGKAVEQYKDGHIVHTYESVSKAARDLKVNRTSIEGAIQRNGTCAGFVWKYKETESEK